MECRDNELCDVGERLWLLVIDDHSDENYREYVDHIKSCEECRRGLEIGEMISDDELEAYAEVQRMCFVSCAEGGLEEYVKVQRASIASYAQGIRDALILTAVAVLLAVIGLLVLL